MASKMAAASLFAFVDTKRVSTVREKSVKNNFKKNEGEKSVSFEFGKFRILKISNEKSGNFIATTHF